MSVFRDLFSEFSVDYSKYRPGYPDALIRYLANLAETRRRAWDCGTGNGQAAVMLGEYFDEVFASDPSESQILHAFKHRNVRYAVEPAESSSLKASSVDVITVASAFHWFQQDKFVAEALRVLVPGGVLATWTYGAPAVSHQVDEVLESIRTKTLGAFWPAEAIDPLRKHPICVGPFERVEEVEQQSFTIVNTWQLSELLGYLSTWSAFRIALTQVSSEIIEREIAELAAAWGVAPEREIAWKVELQVLRRTNILQTLESRAEISH